MVVGRCFWPMSMGGKDFEESVLSQAGRYEREGILKMARNGVEVVLIGGAWRPVPSFVDFRGVYGCGKMFLAECKSTKQKSLPLSESSVKAHQIAELVDWGEWGVPGMLLVHHQGRELKSRRVFGETRVYLVDGRLDWVIEYQEKVVSGRVDFGSLDRSMGDVVPWVRFPRCRKSGPDLREALRLVNARREKLG